MMILKLFGLPIFEFKRSLENPATSLSNPDEWFTDIFSDSKSTAGVNINEDSALKVSAVFACVRVIAETIASLPANVYERVNSNDRKNASDYFLYNLIHSEPSQELSSFVYRETLIAQTLLHGNSFSYIERDNNYKPVSLNLYHPLDVEVFLSDKKARFYKFKDMPDMMVPARDVIHVAGLSFDGKYGKSVIKCAAESIGGGLALQEFSNRFFGNGANLSAVLEYPGKLSDNAQKNIKESFDLKASGLKKSHQVQVLEQGLKYQRTGIPPEDAQFLQSKEFSVIDICRWFRVQPHMVQSLEKSTNNNIEHQSIEHVVYTLRPWLVRLEQEQNRKLIPEKDKGKFYIEHNIAGLLRGDAKARGDFYRTLHNIGAISANEIRALENMNSIEGGNKYYVPLNMVPSDMVEQNLTKNNKKVIKNTEICKQN